MFLTVKHTYASEAPVSHILSSQRRNEEKALEDTQHYVIKAVSCQRQVKKLQDRLRSQLLPAGGPDGHI